MRLSQHEHSPGVPVVSKFLSSGQNTADSPGGTAWGHVTLQYCLVVARSPSDRLLESHHVTVGTEDLGHLRGWYVASQSTNDLGAEVIRPGLRRLRQDLASCCFAVGQRSDQIMRKPAAILL